MACLTPAPLMFLPVLSTSWPSLISSTSCGLFFWIRILNQINSGIGRNTVCREPIHTPPRPFLACCWNWGRGGRKARPPSPLSRTCPLHLPVGPSLSAGPLCYSSPLTPVPRSPRLPSTLEDTQFLRDGSGIRFPKGSGHCSALCSGRNLDYPHGRG